MSSLFDASPFARRARGAPVVAWSAAAPAGRGPESPVAKFLIGAFRAAPPPLAFPFVPPPTHLAPSPRFLTAGGAVTIVFECAGGHFIEFLKIAKQTSTDSYLEIARKVTSTKGFAGTLDGFFPWGAMQAVAKGSVFSFGQAYSMKVMHDWTGVSKDTRTVLSGGIGGLVQGVAMSPLLLLKTRVMTDPVFRTSGGIVATAVASFRVGGRIIANEGPATLFKGVTVFSLKRALDWTTRYLFVVMCENALRSSPGAKLSDLEVVAATLVGGSLSALSTIPMDVMVAGKQSAGSAGKKVGVIETFQAQLREKGVGGMMAFATRGLAARCIHVALTTLMMKSMTTVVYDLLWPEKPAAPSPVKH